MKEILIRCIPALIIVGAVRVSLDTKSVVTEYAVLFVGYVVYHAVMDYLYVRRNP